MYWRSSARWYSISSISSFQMDGLFRAGRAGRSSISPRTRYSIGSSPSLSSTLQHHSPPRFRRVDDHRLHRHRFADVPLPVRVVSGRASANQMGGLRPGVGRVGDGCIRAIHPWLSTRPVILRASPFGQPVRLYIIVTPVRSRPVVRHHPDAGGP